MPPTGETAIGSADGSTVQQPVAREIAAKRSDVCEHCGNRYDKAFTVLMNGQPHVFDSFECAIHKLAPVCDHCGCRIIGHGVEANGTFYCCAHCAHQKGVNAIVDHA